MTVAMTLTPGGGEVEVTGRLTPLSDPAAVRLRVFANGCQACLASWETALGALLGHRPGGDR